MAHVQDQSSIQQQEAALAPMLVLQIVIAAHVQDQNLLQTTDLVPVAQLVYMDIVLIRLELLLQLPLGAYLLFLVVLLNIQKRQHLVFVVVQQAQIECVVLVPPQHQEVGVIIAVHILDRFVHMVQQINLHVIVAHALE